MTHTLVAERYAHRDRLIVQILVGSVSLVVDMHMQYVLERYLIENVLFRIPIATVLTCRITDGKPDV